MYLQISKCKAEEKKFKNEFIEIQTSFNDVYLSNRQINLIFFMILSPIIFPSTLQIHNVAIILRYGNRVRV